MQAIAAGAQEEVEEICSSCKVAGENPVACMRGCLKSCGPNWASGREILKELEKRRCH